MTLNDLDDLLDTLNILHVFAIMEIKSSPYLVYRVGKKFKNLGFFWVQLSQLAEIWCTFQGNLKVNELNEEWVAWRVVTVVKDQRTRGNGKEAYGGEGRGQKIVFFPKSNRRKPAGSTKWTIIRFLVANFEVKLVEKFEYYATNVNLQFFLFFKFANAHQYLQNL